MQAARTTRQRQRRGVTLLEMLVVVALVVLMMIILVQIFSAATGAITVSRTYQELDNNLRMLDQTIRSDLSGATARFTPPLDPRDKLGYFEYGENSFADLQGEDTDDYIAFTTKAPEGQYFSGRVWLPAGVANQFIQPVVVTSQFAEVIYFLRNGNLYRRVMLVAPNRGSSLSLGNLNSSGLTGVNYPGILFNTGGMRVSWQGMNDISCRPSDVSSLFAPSPPIPNDLGDLTDRHKRMFRPRFSNDYFSTPTSSQAPDGVADDNNLDDIPDYYPTLYPNALISGAGILTNENLVLTPYNNPLPGRVAVNYQLFAFPYINPGMYSKPDLTNMVTANGNMPNSSLGWLHSPDPSGSTFNHAPLAAGDSLTTPNIALAAQRSTWFGFPTWRETSTGFRGGALLGWTDPVLRVEVALSQSPGLQPFDPTTTPPANSSNFPPPQRDPFSINNLYASDGAGSANLVPGLMGAPPSVSPDSNPLYGLVWEDDLIMTGVRSFDVKAYDPDAAVYSRPTAAPNAVVYSAGYQDLGYASALDGNKQNFLAAGYPQSAMTTDTDHNNRLIPVLPLFPMQDANFNPVGFGHEGRIPPLINDNRVNPSRPYLNNILTNTGLPETTNLGDNSNAVIRLRRVWDSWSTTYTQAPSVDLNFTGSQLQVGGLDLPVYPSYPAPYPSPLRGIRIQIRVVDPRNERVKILSIDQDFSDKL